MASCEMGLPSAGFPGQYKSLIIYDPPTWDVTVEPSSVMTSFTKTPALDIPPTAFTNLKNCLGLVVISSGSESSRASNSSFSIPLILLENSSGVMFSSSALRAFFTILLWLRAFGGVVRIRSMPSNLLNYVWGQLLSLSTFIMSLWVIPLRMTFLLVSVLSGRLIFLVVFTSNNSWSEVLSWGITIGDVTSISKSCMT